MISFAALNGEGLTNFNKQLIDYYERKNNQPLITGTKRHHRTGRPGDKPKP